MPRAMSGPAALAAAVLGAFALAGCGSSGSGGSAAGRSTAATTGTAPASGASAATSANGSSLQVTGRPRFASPSASEPVLSGVVQVAYRNITIGPDTLRVKVGTTIRWTNFDTVDHNVTSESGPQRFVSKDFGQGQSYAVTLTRPGTVDYECTIHPVTMNGAIEVLK